MRQTLLTATLLVTIAAAHGSFAQTTEPPRTNQLVGIWVGTWEGAGAAGGFELTLEQPKEGALTGKVSVTGEPEYKATFKSVSLEGAKMTAKYDFPPDEGAEVVLVATFDTKSAKGTWSLNAKGDGSQVATGTWSVTKKD
jgi:hypothetical protein